MKKLKAKLKPYLNFYVIVGGFASDLDVVLRPQQCHLVRFETCKADQISWRKDLAFYQAGEIIGSGIEVYPGKRCRLSWKGLPESATALKKSDETLFVIVDH